VAIPVSKAARTKAGSPARSPPTGKRGASKNRNKGSPDKTRALNKSVALISKKIVKDLDPR